MHRQEAVGSRAARNLPTPAVRKTCANVAVPTPTPRFLLPCPSLAICGPSDRTGSSARWWPGFSAARSRSRCDTPFRHNQAHSHATACVRSSVGRPPTLTQRRSRARSIRRKRESTSAGRRLRTPRCLRPRERCTRLCCQSAGTRRSTTRSAPWRRISATSLRTTFTARTCASSCAAT